VPRNVAIVLANDPGTGFTGSKYLVDVGGLTLIDRSIADASSWPVDEVIVVLGPDAEDVVEGLAPTDATIVIDPEWREGSAASLRVGLDVVVRGPATDLVVVALADQVGVRTEDVVTLIEEADGAVATVPKYRYRRGFPIVLTRGMWERLLGLEGEVDLLDLLESHPDGVVEVWFDHLTEPRIERPGDTAARR
jgi:CTP:molybdopterin cytidylyltransferase MocA